MSGRNQIYDLITIVLEGVQHIEDNNGRRANDSWISSLYRSLNRLILFKLSQLDQTSNDGGIINELLEKFIYNQKIIFGPYNPDVDFLKCLCYYLYKFLFFELNIGNENHGVPKQHHMR